MAYAVRIGEAVTQHHITTTFTKYLRATVGSIAAQRLLEFSDPIPPTAQHPEGVKLRAPEDELRLNVFPARPQLMLATSCYQVTRQWWQ